MRFVDTAIPKFNSAERANFEKTQPFNDAAPDILKPSGFFLKDQLVDYPLEDGNDENTGGDEDKFVDAENDSSQVRLF